MILFEAVRYRLFLYRLFIVRSTYETIGHSVIIDSEFDLIVFVNKLNLVIIIHCLFIFTRHNKFHLLRNALAGYLSTFVCSPSVVSDCK